MNLNEIHNTRDTAISNFIKSEHNGKVNAEKTDQIRNQAEKEIQTNHSRFLTLLENDLSAIQIETVKDGLTYGIVKNTYKGYVEMLPDLTEKQKNQIMTWLVEAREHAMDGGTSEEKHAWFGKYKGRINNYLSSEGYDLKKAGEDWEKRIRERKQ